MKPRLRLLLFGPVLCASLIAVLPQATQAAVFERDWKTPGDGLLTYDDVNGREWLDLSETLLEQFPRDSLGERFPQEERYQYAILDLAPGMEFAGFAVANRPDILDFSESAGIITGTGSFDTNEAATGDLIDLLGATATFPNGDKFALGFVDEFSVSKLKRIGAIFKRDLDSGFNGSAGMGFSISDDFLRRPSIAGVMLYRTAVPEPSTLLLFLTSLICCTSMRRELKYQA